MSGKEQLDAILDRLAGLDRRTRDKVVDEALAATAHLAWVPNPGPQTEAYYSQADELFYGGQAGGGKSDLLLGLALNCHRRSLILRRVNKDAAELGERLTTIRGSNAGYNAQLHIARIGDRLIELAGCEQEKDKQRYKGRAHSLKGYDEIGDFLESQYLFINQWNRSTIIGERSRIVACGNPPTTAEGQWVVRRWAAWLDPNHPNPAVPGELRWYLRTGDTEVEVEGPGPYEVAGERKLIRALSRTFIRSALDDNPDLEATGYDAQLASAPEALRRAYRDGDFSVGLEDDAWQVFPSAWVEAACQRWEKSPPKGLAMTAIGVDIAQGGPDQTVLAPRYGGWFAPLVVQPGKDTREGYQVSGLVVRHRRDRCPVIVDVGGGYGADALVSLKDNGINVLPFNGVVDSKEISRCRQFGFKNKRAAAHWRFREALDPEQEGGSPVALPNDPLLKADLAAVHWRPVRGPDAKRALILIEEKAAIKERIGRSPDRGDAVVMGFSEGERAVKREQLRTRQAGRPGIANLGFAHMKKGYGR